MGGKLLLLMGAVVVYLNSLVLSEDRQGMVFRNKTDFADTLKIDSASGLIVGEHLDIVKAQCATVCHSAQTIRVNRFTRDGWKGKILWMQANHNLWELGDTEKLILDYLEKYYSPGEERTRRAPLKDIEWYPLGRGE